MNLNSGLEILVVGGIYSEYLVQGNHQASSEKQQLLSSTQVNESSRLREIVGGEGAQEAIACAHLSSQVGLVARVGNDWRGKYLTAQLQQDKIETQFLITDALAPTGVSWVMIDDQKNMQISRVRGASHRLNSSDVMKCADAFRTAKVVIVESDGQPSSVQTAVCLGAGLGAKIILDPCSSVPLHEQEEVIRLADFIKTNAEKAQRLTGIPVDNRHSARMAGERIQAYGVPYVLIEVRDQGYLFLIENEELWFPASNLEKGNRAWWGKGFTAGVAVALSENHNLADAILFGERVAHLSSPKRSGLYFPSREEVLPYLGKNAERFHRPIVAA